MPFPSAGLSNFKMKRVSNTSKELPFRSHRGIHDRNEMRNTSKKRKKNHKEPRTGGCKEAAQAHQYHKLLVETKAGEPNSKRVKLKALTRG